MKIIVTCNGKTKTYKNLKSCEITPIYDGVELCITDKNDITESYALYNEFDENWKVELKR